MKKAWNDAKVIFTALQACSVVALLPVLIVLEGAMKGVFHGEMVTVLRLTIEAGLWGWMWLSFLRMCGRLKREPSAFTQRNARTLLVIAICCGALGVIMAAEEIVSAQVLTRGLLFGGWIGSLATMAMFFGVCAVALVLRRMLNSAMALQQDSDLTI